MKIVQLGCERVVVQQEGAEPLNVYLIELTSVTIAAAQGLARVLRDSDHDGIFASGSV
jgi:hypothetical protein